MPLGISSTKTTTNNLFLNHSSNPMKSFSRSSRVTRSGSGSSSSVGSNNGDLNSVASSLESGGDERQRRPRNEVAQRMYDTVARIQSNRKSRHEKRRKYLQSSHYDQNNSSLYSAGNPEFHQQIESVPSTQALHHRSTKPDPPASAVAPRLHLPRPGTDINNTSKNTSYSDSIKSPEYQQFIDSSREELNTSTSTTASSALTNSRTAGTLQHHHHHLPPSSDFSSFYDPVRRYTVDAVSVDNTSVYTGMSQQDLLRKKARASKNQQKKSSKKKKRKGAIVQLPAGLLPPMVISPPRTHPYVKTSSSRAHQDGLEHDEGSRLGGSNKDEFFTKSETRSNEKRNNNDFSFQEENLWKSTPVVEDLESSTAETTNDDSAPQQNQQSQSNETSRDNDDVKSVSSLSSFPLLSRSAKRVLPDDVFDPFGFDLVLSSQKQQQQQQQSTPEKSPSKNNQNITMITVTEETPTHSQETVEERQRLVRFAEDIATCMITQRRNGSDILSMAAKLEQKRKQSKRRDEEIPWDEDSMPVVEHNYPSPTSIMEAVSKSVCGQPKSILRPPRFSGRPKLDISKNNMSIDSKNKSSSSGKLPMYLEREDRALWNDFQKATDDNWKPIINLDTVSDPGFFNFDFATGNERVLFNGEASPKLRRSRARSHSPPRSKGNDFTLTEDDNDDDNSTPIPIPNERELSPPRDNSFMGPEGVELSPIRPHRIVEVSLSEVPLSHQFGHPAEKHIREQIASVKEMHRGDIADRVIVDEEFPDPGVDMDFDDESTVMSAYAFIETVASIVIQTAVRRYLAALRVQKMINAREEIARNKVQMQPKHSNPNPYFRTTTVRDLLKDNNGVFKMTENPNNSMMDSSILNSSHGQKSSSDDLGSLDTQTMSVSFHPRSSPQSSLDYDPGDLFDLAAIQIQAAFRGFWVRDSLDVDHFCAVLIQKTIRGLLCHIKYRRTIRDIIIVQSWWRRNIVRDYAANVLYSAIVIQGLFRGFCVRKAIKEYRTTIKMKQYAHRQRALQARRAYFIQSKELSKRPPTMVATLYNEDAVDAAVKIQARWRTFVAESQLIRSLVDVLIVQTVVRRWLACRIVWQLRRDRSIEMGRSCYDSDGQAHAQFMKRQLHLITAPPKFQFKAQNSGKTKAGKNTRDNVGTVTAQSSRTFNVAERTSPKTNIEDSFVGDVESVHSVDRLDKNDFKNPEIDNRGSSFIRQNTNNSSVRSGHIMNTKRYVKNENGNFNGSKSNGSSLKQTDMLKNGVLDHERNCDCAPLLPTLHHSDKSNLDQCEEKENGIRTEDNRERIESPTNGYGAESQEPAHSETKRKGTNSAFSLGNESKRVANFFGAKTSSTVTDDMEITEDHKIQMPKQVEAGSSYWNKVIQKAIYHPKDKKRGSPEAASGEVLDPKNKPIASDTEEKKCSKSVVETGESSNDAETQLSSNQQLEDEVEKSIHQSTEKPQADVPKLSAKSILALWKEKEKKNSGRIGPTLPKQF